MPRERKLKLGGGDSLQSIHLDTVPITVQPHFHMLVLTFFLVEIPVLD